MRGRRYLAIAITSALAVFAPVAGAGASGVPTFERLNVAPMQHFGEPRILIDPDAPGAKYFVVGPGLNQTNGTDTLIWWSADGRHYNGPLSTHEAAQGNDSDIAIGPDHVVYAADLHDLKGDSAIPISVWDPVMHGFSYRGMVAPGRTDLDRQWIASPAPGVVTATASTEGGQVLAWVSTDGGAHFAKPVVVSRNASLAGPIAPGPVVNGVRSLSFAFVYDDPNSTLGYTEIRVAKSIDGGRHWTGSHAIKNNYTPLFPVVAVDSSGGAYVVCSCGDPAPLTPVQTSEWVIVFAATHDGRSWTKPSVASSSQRDPAHNLPVAIFPWVVARSPGHVDVTYVIEKEPVFGSVIGPDFGGPESKWDVRVGQSLNAFDAKPTFRTAVIAANFHTGSICEGGSGCLGPQSQGLVNAPTPFDRRELDFIGSAIDASGRLYVPYTPDRSATTGNPTDVISSAIAVRVGRQTGGQLLP